MPTASAWSTFANRVGASGSGAYSSPRLKPSRWTPLRARVPKPATSASRSSIAGGTAGAAGLVVGAVVDGPELGQDRLAVVGPHRENRGEVLEDEDLVREPVQERRVIAAGDLEPAGERLRRQLGERIEAGDAPEAPQRL